MKKSHYWAMLATVVSLCCPVSAALGQAPAAPSGGTRVALLDVDYIFTNHVRLKGMMEDLKREMQQAQAWSKQQYEALTKQKEDLQNYQKGTPQYKQMEEELASRQAQFNVQMQLKKKELFQREAAMFNNVYQEILQATDYYCKQNGIDIVMRFKGDSVDPQQPESIAGFIQRPVVWYQQGLDITPIILQDLNRGAAAADRRAAPAQQPAPRGPFSPR